MKKTLLMAGMVLAGCAGSGSGSGGFQNLQDPEELFQQAKQAYDQGQFDQASEMFKTVALSGMFNERTDDAEYYLGMCYLKMKQTEKARGAFQAVITSFSESEFAPLAYIGLARAYLAEAPPIPRDQTKTQNAIQTLEKFLRKYPDHPEAPEAKKLLKQCKERMAKKELGAIVVYENLMKYEAVIHYAKVFLQEYPDSRYRWEVMLRQARALFMLNKTDKALAVLGNIESGKNVPGDVMAEAKQLRIKVQSSITPGQ